MLTAQQLMAQGGVILGESPVVADQPAPTVNRVSMEQFYAEPISMGSFMGETHNAQAQTATGNKRTRQGTNRVCPRLDGSISMCKFTQAIGLRTGWNGKDMVPLAQKVLALFGWADAGFESVKTALYDGSHALTKKGTVNAQHKPAQLSEDLLKQLDNAVLFVTAPAAK